MTRKHHTHNPASGNKNLPAGKSHRPILLFVIPVVILLGIALWWLYTEKGGRKDTAVQQAGQAAVATAPHDTTIWIERAVAVGRLFHTVYTPCWEGAYGAIGDAYLFGVTHDSSLLRFHTVEHDMRAMCTGTWVDDRAWICLAEFAWWDITGRKDFALIADARNRYLEARSEGRLSDAEGFWSWYNYPPGAAVNERIFTNSNMNQMAAVACRIYEATREQEFLDDALLVWKGDGRLPGIIQTLYKGDGRWEGKAGLAAFGKQLPWEGAEYCSIGACLYRITGDTTIRKVIIATAKRILDPATGWVDPVDYYQIRMDGNGAFVNYLMDAYAVAPKELPEVPAKVGAMLEHVWTNHHGTSSVTLHRTSDDGIRNGWNPYGGEDGYGVDEVGTVHAQSEAMRAFGIYSYYFTMANRVNKQAVQ